MIRYAVPPLLLLLALAGCIQLPSASDPVRVIAPSARIAPDPAWPAAPWTLLVQRPVADQMRGSSRIVVLSAGSRLSFYPGVTWLDDLPDMLQSLLIQAFVDSTRVAGVARPGAARGTRLLALDVRRTELAETADRSLAAEIEWHANLIDVPSATIIATRVLEARAPLHGSGVAALTVAFEDALGQAIADLVGWALVQGSVDVSPAR